ncbi:MAG: hypothetical protein WCE90_05660 [Candidatus Zixiibacteriota bacterium]
MRRNEAVAMTITPLSFVVGVCYYSRLPEKVSCHGNAPGRHDAYLSRSTRLISRFFAGIVISRAVDPFETKSWGSVI